MPRANTFLTCAYESCKRRTDDKRAFGHVNTLTDHQQLVYSAWLKSQHDRVVCNCHYTSLRRQLAKEQQTQSAARMALLLAAVPAPAVVDSAVLVSPIQPARSLSLPVALALPALPPPAPLARATSMPLLSANTRLCDARQRKRVAFTCVMSGMTWTAYNRQKRLACEHGQRRATHERASHSRGHDYQHTPPLYVEDENGEEVKRKRKARRSKEQMDADKAEEQAEKRRLAVLFERGDTTFTTLGVIDVNLQPKGTKGRKKGKCDDELEGEEAGKEAGKKAGKGEKEDGQDEQVVETATANKENVDPSLPSVPRKRQRRVERTLIERKELSAERTPVLAVVVTDVSAASRQSAVNAAAVCAPVVARMITFR